MIVLKEKEVKIVHDSKRGGNQKEQLLSLSWLISPLYFFPANDWCFPLELVLIQMPRAVTVQKGRKSTRYMHKKVIYWERTTKSSRKVIKVLPFASSHRPHN